MGCFDEDPNETPTAECEMCGDLKMMSDPVVTQWCMQHLHFFQCNKKSEDIDFLTCEKCKMLDPTEFARKINKRQNGKT